MISLGRLERHAGPLFEANWFARSWLPAAVRAFVRRTEPIPVRPGEWPRWITEAHRYAPISEMQGRRVVVFASLPWWVEYMTAVSAQLVSLGCDVTLAWLPWKTYEGPDPRRDAHLRYRYTRAFRHEWSRFRAVDLERSRQARADNAAEAALTKLAKIDTLYVLRREQVDMAGAERDTYEFRLQRSRSSYSTFRALLEDRPHDVVLMPSGGVLEFASAWQAARDVGSETVTIEGADRLQEIAVASNRTVFDEIARELWDSDRKVVDDARRLRVEATMRDREGTAAAPSYAMAWQQAAVEDAEKLREKLHLDKDRPVVLVCPNVPFDAAFLAQQSLFPSMSSWLVQAVKHFATRPEVQVIVRAHPCELLFAPVETSETVLRDAFPTLPRNVRLVLAAEKINTYSLMRLSNLGLVYCSTTGLEFAMRGVPVVTPVNAHYTRKGFTRDASTPEEYFAAIDEQLSSLKPMKKAEVDLAWCYADVFFNQWTRPFPWSVPNFSNEFREWPLERTRSPEGMQRFAETFLMLVGGERARELAARPPTRGEQP